jgi:hypothetical protein
MSLTDTNRTNTSRTSLSVTDYPLDEHILASKLTEYMSQQRLRTQPSTCIFDAKNNTPNELVSSAMSAIDVYSAINVTNFDICSKICNAYCEQFTYYYYVLLSQVFFLPWYFSPWASGEPHHSVFQSQLVALSLWCVMFLVLSLNVSKLQPSVRLFLIY